MKSSAQTLRLYPRTPLTDAAPERDWLVAAGGTGIELAALPLPWPGEADGRPVAIRLERTHRRADAGRASIAITVADGKLGGLLAYLGRGRLDAAEPFLDALGAPSAEEGRAAARIHPLGACAAAYVGLAILAPDEAASRIGDPGLLACRFPWLPDASILEARSLIRKGRDPRDAVRAAKAAYRRGIPYFAAGIPQLQDLLFAYGRDDVEAREMLDAVGAVASRLDPSRVFTTLLYPDPVS